MDWTLMFICARWHLDVHVWPRGWSRAAKQQWWETHPSTTGGPPRDWLLLCQSVSCSVSACTICLSVWVTAEWQVPSENMAHNVNARQARGLRKDCSCPSLFPISSVTPNTDVTALSSLKNLFADISAFCHTTQRRWLTDWLTEEKNTLSVTLSQIWWIGVFQLVYFCVCVFIVSCCIIGSLILWVWVLPSRSLWAYLSNFPM